MDRKEDVVNWPILLHLSLLQMDLQLFPPNGLITQRSVDLNHVHLPYEVRKDRVVSAVNHNPLPIPEHKGFK
jgi:hypothetical protein